MKKHSKQGDELNRLRDKIIGLGERSIRKSYYPELRARFAELEKSNARLKQEIDERKRTEKALIESENRFRDLAELLPAVIFESDMSGNIIYLNQNAFEQFQYSKDDLDHGINAVQMVVDEDRARVIENMQRVHDGNSSNASEYSFLRKDLSTFFGMVRSTPMVHDGKPSGLRGLIFDITDRKKAEEERLKLQVELQKSRKMEAIGTLAGGIAHDFNNILQGIIGYTELLLMKKDQLNPDYDKLNSIYRASERAAELIQNLLIFSREVEPARRPVDLNREIEQATKMLERTIPKMIEIELNTQNRLWTIKADPIQIEQILLNLGNNAADAMPGGGTLLIETENVTFNDKLIKIPFPAKTGNFVLLAISDTGHGMDGETMEHIFDPFFTTKEIGKGTGLGLASVYGIVKSHGGNITCYSEIGHGTTFKIFFPAHQPMGPEPHAEEEDTKIPRGTETVLLVDDEESILASTSLALTTFGYGVLTAATGEEAFEIYIQNAKNIDVVIMDIGLPGMGGQRCLEKILSVDPAAKIIIASGYSLHGYLKNSLIAGAAAYMGKPFGLNHLLKKVREVLDRES